MTSTTKVKTPTNNKTLLTVKIDKDLKRRAEKTAASFGLPLGTMVNVLIRRTVEEGRLELEVPSARALRRINQIRKQIDKGKLPKGYEVNELIAKLRG